MKKSWRNILIILLLCFLQLFAPPVFSSDFTLAPDNFIGEPSAPTVGATSAQSDPSVASLPLTSTEFLVNDRGLSVVGQSTDRFVLTQGEKEAVKILTEIAINSAESQSVRSSAGASQAPSLSSRKIKSNLDSFLDRLEKVVKEAQQNNSQSPRTSSSSHDSDLSENQVAPLGRQLPLRDFAGRLDKFYEKRSRGGKDGKSKRFSKRRLQDSESKFIDERKGDGFKGQELLNQNPLTSQAEMSDTSMPLFEDSFMEDPTDGREPMLEIGINQDTIETHRLLNPPRDLNPMLRLILRAMVTKKQMLEYQAILAKLREINVMTRENKKGEYEARVKYNGQLVKYFFPLFLSFDEEVTVELYLLPSHETDQSQPPASPVAKT